MEAHIDPIRPLRPHVLLCNLHRSFCCILDLTSPDPSYQRYSEEQIHNTCLNGNGGDIEKCVAVIINNTNEHQRAQDDLVAQSEMARWAFYMFIATVVMAGITGVGVIFVWLTLRATRDMAADTLRISEAQVRAYVHIAEYKTFFWRAEGKARCLIQISINNSGASPGIFNGYSTETSWTNPINVSSATTLAMRELGQNGGFTVEIAFDLDIADKSKPVGVQTIIRFNYTTFLVATTGRTLNMAPISGLTKSPPIGQISQRKTFTPLFVMGLSTATPIGLIKAGASHKASVRTRVSIIPSSPGALLRLLHTAVNNHERGPGFGVGYGFISAEGVAKPEGPIADAQ